MFSLPLALLGGVLIGIVESLLYTNVINTPSLISMVLFVLVLILVLDDGAKVGLRFRVIEEKNAERRTPNAE